MHLASGSIDAEGLDGAVGRLLERHPAYREQLERHAPLHLEPAECELLYWADRCLTIAEIAAKTGRSVVEVGKIAASLADHALVEVRPVSRAMAALQRFFAAQTLLAPPASQTLQALWKESCDAFAERPLITADGDGSVFRYADASAVITRVAAALQREGVRRGDLICLCAPTSAEAAFVFWACMQVGVALAPLDCGDAAARTVSLVLRLKPRLVFCDAARFESVAATVTEDSPSVAWIVFDEDDGDGSKKDHASVNRASKDPSNPFDRVVGKSALSFSEWIGADEGSEPKSLEPVDGEDLAVLLHTSGTSGEPKGVELSHGALYRSGLLMARTYGWRAEDVLLATGDLHAVSGLRNPLVAAVVAGASFVVAGADARRHPLALAEVVQRHRVSVLTTVPGMLRLVTQYEDRLPHGSLASLRQVLSTGCPLPRAVAEAFGRRFAIPILDYYGLTETTGLCVGVMPQDADAAAGTIGRPLECIAQIVADDGIVLGPGHVGELRIYSENLMRGYYRDSTATAGALRNGWYATGDLAVRDERGFITLLSRRGDVVKNARGDLVHPAELEAVLMTHPEVADAGACGYWSDAGEERLAAFIVPHPGVESTRLVQQLRQYLLQALGQHRLPARFEVVAALPRAADGALLRRVLAESCR